MIMALDQVDVDKLEEQESSGKEMSFLDHLEELRWHILKSLSAIAIFGVVLFIFQEWMFKTIIFGPTRGDFITYRVLCGLSKSLGLGDAICFTAPEFKMQATTFGEPFVTSMLVAFWMGLVIAFPYILRQIWLFIGPGLYDKERKAARGMVAICSALFMLGVLFGYFILAPFSIRFLVGYTIPGVTNIPTMSSYLNYLIMFTIPIGLVFELPIVVYFLARIGLITGNDMRNYRRHAIVVILIVAGIITPPDVVSQMMVTIPLYVLYEVSIVIAKRVAPKEEEDDDAPKALPQG
jgi:sec-independent protein translocase protein TatC